MRRFSLFLVAAMAQGAWNLEVVDTGVLPVYPYMPSVQIAHRTVLQPAPGGGVTALQHTAIVYEDKNSGYVKLARRTGTGAWTIESIGYGSKPSVALDQTGKAHIAWWSIFPQHFRYARSVAAGSGDCGTGNNFACEQIAFGSPGGDFGTWIRLGSDQNVHVYLKKFDGLPPADAYLRKSGAAPFQVVFTAQGGGYAIDLDAENKLHHFWIVPDMPTRFMHTANLSLDVYMQQVGPSVDTGISNMKSAAKLDASGLPRVCVSGAGGSSSPLMYYRQQSNLQWYSQQIVAANAAHCSINLHSSGTVGISYRATDSNVLRYAERQLIGWALSTVDNNAGDSSILAFQGNGQPMIAYFDVTNNRLMLARRE